MSEFSDAQSDSVGESNVSVGLLPMLTHWFGVIVSFFLVAGLIYWGINLVNRDPNQVPIIRAMEGPARIQPDDPGGEQAQHQGLTVNAIQTDAGTGNAADRLVLAPEAESLSDSDLPGLGLTPRSRPDPKDLIASAIAEDASSVQDSEEMDVAAQVITTGTGLSPAKSPHPKSRPSGLSVQAVAQLEDTELSDHGGFPALVPVGSRLIQLGAFDSEDLALAEWDILRVRHSDLLEGKQRLIQVADSSGRKFFRLRAAGFATLDDSRNLCTAMVARGTSCIPVTAR